LPSIINLVASTIPVLAKCMQRLDARIRIVLDSQHERELIKRMRILNMMVEQIEGVDPSLIEVAAQQKIDIAAWR